MTKPDDIPQDVRQQARLIYFNRCDEVSRLAAEFEEEEVVDLLIRAIMAEREACAQVATDFSDRIGASHFVAVQVAAAIRSRGS